MARFFVELEMVVGHSYELPSDVVRHINVLRLKSSDEIILFNGDGSDYQARFLNLEKRSASVEIIAATLLDNEAPLRICLLMALIANDKFDWVLQKAVELGVHEIIPLYCQNTQRFKGERLESRINHWQKIIISASEQSGRACLMKLHEPQDFAAGLALVDTSDKKYILSPHHAGNISAEEDTPETIALVIGPEGGLTTQEIAVANQNGFQSVLLGKRILRAETAAIAGISVLQTSFGDFIS